MKIKALLAILLLVVGCGQASHELAGFPEVKEKAGKGSFPLAAAEAATICVDNSDARVVSIAAGLLAEIFSIHTEDLSAEWRWNVLQEIRIK